MIWINVVVLSSSHIPRFHEYEDTVAKRITTFMEFFVAWDIMDEDIRIRIFVISLNPLNNQGVRNWYQEISP